MKPVHAPLPGWQFKYLDAPARHFHSPDAAMGFAAILDAVHSLTRGEQLECRVDCVTQTITLARPVLADVLQLGRPKANRRAELRRLGRMISLSDDNGTDVSPAPVADT